jgi:hypothetical protein
MAHGKKEINVDRINPWPWIGTGLGVVGCILGGTALNGNEHGASKTDLDTMPSYSVGSESPAVTKGPTLPPAAQKAAMWVCYRIVVDRQRGEVIINPVVEKPTSGRPLYLTGVTAAGAQFANDLPRDNFSVFKRDGGEDNDSQLSPDECRRVDVVPRAVDGPEPYILVESDSGLRTGADIAPGPAGALDAGQVHGQFNGLTGPQIDEFLDDLPAY